MIKILLNYDYSLYPYTTASYIEMASKEIEGVRCYKVNEKHPEKIDLVINIMPFDTLWSWKRAPSCYWEIDCHMIQGSKTDYYNAVDRVYIAQSYYLDLYPPEKTFYLPLACDPNVHKRSEHIKQNYDIGFLGNDTYPDRRMLLDQLQENYHILRNTGIYGPAYSRELSKCMMIFNMSMLHDVNMRFFEGMAIGRLLLTDYLPEQDEFATPGIHYEIYKDFPELKKKIDYYIEYPALRERIALQGSRNIRQNHTYKHRLLKILTDFNLIK